ncbi:MAG: hypothetical protein AAGJ82_12860, partial [Bacteroidota bacterium]
MAPLLVNGQAAEWTAFAQHLRRRAFLYFNNQRHQYQRAAIEDAVQEALASVWKQYRTGNAQVRNWEAYAFQAVKYTLYTAASIDSASVSALIMPKLLSSG